MLPDGRDSGSSPRLNHRLLMDTFCLLPTIFLHFFDLHFLELKTPGVDPEVLKRECRLATRLSYLAGEEVLIPAASYFESPLCREVVYELYPLFDFGVLRLVVGGSNVAEFFDDKQQYAKTSPSHQVYFGKVPAGHPPFRPRQCSATKDIVECWVDHLNRGKAGDLFLGTGIKVPKKLEVNWEKAPRPAGEARSLSEEFASCRRKSLLAKNLL